MRVFIEEHGNTWPFYKHTTLISYEQSKSINKAKVAWSQSKESSDSKESAENGQPQLEVELHPEDAKN